MADHPDATAPFPGHAADPARSGPAGTDPAPWVLEHYGFADEGGQAAPTIIASTGRATSEGPAALPPAPAESRAHIAAGDGRPEARGSRRLRLGLASGVLALALTAGGAGVVAAQAAAGDGGGRSVTATQAAGDHAHDGGSGGPGGRR